MRKLKLKLFLVLFVLTFPLTGINAQDILSGHRGKITSLIHNGDSIISAGEDGFIVTWNVKEKKSLERFQLTPYSIQTVVKHPSRPEICIVEAAAVDDYRISVWNYRFKDRLFSLQTSEPVSFINYSAGGSFIIACGLNGSPITILASGTGQIVAEPNIPQGNVPLALTGKAEQSMLIYQTDTENGGQLLYLNLRDNSSLSGSFNTRDNLLNPIIFGNGRFLAGTSSSGLFVIDAASGNEIANVKNIERGALLCPAEDGFLCLSGKGDKRKLYRFSLARNGSLAPPQEIKLSIDSGNFISALSYNGSTALSCEDGSLFLLEQNGNCAQMAHNFQTRTVDIAASASRIAVLTEEDDLFFLPLDYARLQNGETLKLEKKIGYTQISALDSKTTETQGFILWQKTNTRNAPLFVYPDLEKDDTSLKFLLGRFSIDLITSKNDMLLILDKAGVLSLFNLDTIIKESASSQNSNPAPFFSMTIPGAVGAAFRDGENLLLCLSSVIANRNPFMFVNIKTHETIPVSYPSALAGLMAYAGKGKLYGAALETQDGILKTCVLNLSQTSSEKIYEYPGEDANISITESGGLAAVSCGNEGAAIFGRRPVYFERTEGLPLKLIGCEKFFLCADSEGNISWHDNKTGKLLAIFKINEDGWILKSGKIISGNFSQ